jgi:hypothetical protein
MKKGLIFVLVLAAAVGSAATSSLSAEEAEESAVRRAALDYIEGWFEGSVERMDRALHPRLAKRLVEVDPQTGREKVIELTKDIMLEYTKRGGGSRVPADRRLIKITIVDMPETMAMVRSDCSQFIDFLTLAKGEGGAWKIINVLWENVRVDSAKNNF